MRFNERRLFLKLGLIFAAIHLVLYLPVHISYQEFFGDAGAGLQLALGIAVSFLGEVANFILPIVAATVIFISYAYNGAAHAMPRVLFSALPYLVSAVPENYLKYLAYTDSVGAIGFSLLISLFTVLIFSVEVLALFGVMCIFCRVREGNGFSSLEADAMFDFSLPFTRAQLFSCVTVFAIRFITEAVSTVSYIVAVAGAYRMREILTIVFTFLFITLLFVLSYVLAYRVKEKLLDNRLEIIE